MLRSLHVTLAVDTDGRNPDTMRPHAACVAQLSNLTGLTGLTSLKLKMSHEYADYVDSRRWQLQDGEHHGAWVEVREVHRTSLLSALRCMPQLQLLYCPTLWLRPSELPACLTALTRLALGGLLPPPLPPAAEHSPSSFNDGGGACRPYGALPPQLQELVLGSGLTEGASPRAIALLQPGPAFTRLDVHKLVFGISDVTPDGRLRPEAVAAVGPAVRLLAAHGGLTQRSSSFYIAGDGSAALLLPREDSPNGHVEWIRQLQGLEAYRARLELQSLALTALDMCCLAQALPGLTGERGRWPWGFNYGQPWFSCLGAPLILAHAVIEARSGRYAC